jgi:hypothetical protein
LLLLKLAQFQSCDCAKKPHFLALFSEKQGKIGSLFTVEILPYSLYYVYYQ